MKEKQLLTLPGRVTATSLELPPRLNYDEWRVIGLRLALFKEFTNFALGDWLCYGEAQPWGDRYTQAASDTGIPEDRLMILKYVSSRVTILVRNKNLKWSFHKEVAKLEPKEQKDWLDRAEKEGWQLKDLRDKLAAAGLRKARVSHETVPLAETEIPREEYEPDEDYDCHVEPLETEEVDCHYCGKRAVAIVLI